MKNEINLQNLATAVMKKLTLAISSFFLVLVACGQHGPMTGDYFLLLKDQRTVSVNTYEDGQLFENKTHKINKNMIYATDGVSNVALLDTAKNALLIFDINSSKEIRLTTPSFQLCCFFFEDMKLVRVFKGNVSMSETLLPISC